MKKEWLPNLATGVLVACALVITALVVRREFFAAAPATSVDRPVYVDEWREYAAAGHAIGPADAPVTLVEFSDFQCPACRVLAGSLADLRERYPDELRVVYRHFPLRSHEHALDAAKAAECAGAQDRFGPYHDQLFASQDSIGVLPWRAIAERAGVADLAAFDRCVADPAPVPALDRDTAAANRLEVRGTPTFLLNGHRYVGAPSAAELDRLIRQALDAARD